MAVICTTPTLWMGDVRSIYKNNNISAKFIENFVFAI